ncbi:cytolethal distending toxin subunit B family protein [Helicobacter sp.]|uniref:cytolethal distending toxin subunit B family protein n=1 Tax=Helicobacter sp. TaxID=218 RepID=UPI0025BF33BA|nr:cytolethal distending toxin subunit B family protein [Helicobacter sp.]MCI5969418.1 cytolethal distending toxin subunit B family protein [Helicobacter sp.]MDY2585673.1 cytolethal distending toxin subunit B family protein [Helicobacter sp.]
MRMIVLMFLSFTLLLGKIEDYVVGTWNLQGSSASTENKWNVSVRQLITGDNPVDILMVQEAGRVPASARLTGRMIQPGGTPIQEYVWDLGTRSRPRMVFIYYADIDVGARRVNLAIVSGRQVDEVFVIPQTIIAPNVSRPAIGIRIGNDAFFNIHALASGGGDATALVTAVHDNFLDRPDINWLIAGDFNRDPANLIAGLDRRITNHTRVVSQNTATHFSRTGANRILDYAIVGRSSNEQTTQLALPAITALLMAASVRSHLSSDHFPVRFGKF